jgi:purine-binding chemotaxis protein CheW
MDGTVQLLAYGLDDITYALHLHAVVRVFPAVEVTPLPDAPGSVLGIINVRGRVVPVINMRKKLRLPEREIELQDQLIMATTARRTVALVVDAVAGVVECPESELAGARDVVADGYGEGFIEGVVTLGNGMVLIQSLDRFLSSEEEERLDASLQKGVGTVSL